MDPAVLPAGRDGGAGTSDARDDDLESLRSILIGPAERQLQTLQARMDDRFAHAREVGAVLPQALLHRASDPDLARALTPSVEQAITTSVRRDPKPLADALFPVFGPAIRKAVAASLAAMVESLNRTLEYSFSARALRWRIEALRTGKSFGEIVLLHTLLYRVEQVFLIHRRTGLLLQHLRAGTSRVEDAQMVSAMLTAIRDFVHDSFRVPEGDSLDALKVGDLSVWIEQGPSAVVAAVIRGAAPPDLRRVLQDTVETIHLQCGDALDSFDGDAAPFESCRPILERCLQTAYRTEQTRRPRGTLVLAALLLVPLAVWTTFAVRDRVRWTRYLEALRSEPGVVVISEGRRGGRHFVAGLRDPLARDPGALLAASHLSPTDVVGTWEPYQALGPQFVLARARAILRPPPATTLALQGGVLLTAGQAPLAWIAEAQRLAPLIPGITRFDASGLLESQIRLLSRRIEESRLLFVKGTARLVPGQDEQLRQLGDRLRELDAVAASAGRRLRVAIVGHTDSDGAPEENGPLSRARASRIQTVLALQSTPQLEVQATGAGSDEPLTTGPSESDKQQNRRVVLRIGDASASRPQGGR